MQSDSFKNQNISKYIVLDRDDTLNEDPGYISDPGLVKLKPGVIEGLQLLRDFGFLFIIATNQSGVARKKITPSQLAEVNNRLISILNASGITIEKLYFCPHVDEDKCDCRKPLPGMLNQLIEDFRIQNKVYLVGDKTRDLIPGEKGGHPGILIAETIPDEKPANLVFVAKDMKEAAKYILEDRFNQYSLSKVLNLGEAINKCEFYRNRNDSIVFTNGCFDILHAGHLQYLYQASLLADRLVVGLNSDRSVRAIKGQKRPLNNEQDRAMLLANLSFVDEVVIFDEDTPENLLSRIKPDIHVKGGDYRVEDLPEADRVKRNSGKVIILPCCVCYSTTSIIEKMKN